ncbi:MAG: DUF4406 domain-containing protein [Candidatus Methanoperedens sp.]
MTTATVEAPIDIFSIEAHRGPVTSLYKHLRTLDRGEMATVFICSPYTSELGDADEVRQNREKAIYYCKKAFDQGKIPFCSHLLYPQILDDSDPKDRALGIYAGIKFMQLCDEIWIFLPDGMLPTKGMRIEMNIAKNLKMKRVVITDPEVL